MPVESDMKFAAYIQAVKDDFCLLEVCERLFNDGLTTFFFCIPDEYWSGRQVTSVEMFDVLMVAEKIRKQGAQVFTKVFQVGLERVSDRSRIQIETVIRNQSLDWIRDSGFPHVIIVDGDELWKRGYVRDLMEYVKVNHPESVSLGMIPTIGLPGYAIDEAEDSATVYVGPKVYFNLCRGVENEDVHHFKTVRAIIHFTATRRTMQEIIDKHRESGHYDDPEYAFETWIKETLPNVKEGMTNVHMYVPYQIWPVVRKFTEDEINEIPASLVPYLHFGSSSSSNPH